MKTKPRILFYDLETSPLLAWVWSRYQDGVIDVEEEWEILSAAWKFQGDRKVQVISQKNGRSEFSIVSKLWELFEEADIVIGHNSDKFDNKKANAKLLEYEFNPPSFYATVDTLKVARKYYKLTSNRLDALGELLGVGRKVKHSGFELWRSCMQGDRKAWEKMESYNKQDVRLLQRVYKKLKPWIDNHPHIGLLLDKGKESCNRCGSRNFRSEGIRVTASTKYRRLKCSQCGGSAKGKV